MPAPTGGLPLMRRSLVRRVALAGGLALAGLAPLAALATSSSAHNSATATFTPYVVTDGKNPGDGGEPSLGYDAKHDVLVFGAAIHQTKMKFTDSKHGTTLTQTDV